MKKLTIGDDISKDHLDAHCRTEGRRRRFANAPTGFRALIKWIGPDAASLDRIVYEATGPYHRAFEQVLSQAALPLAKVNPRQARRFAEATGKLAKTDQVDAAMLALMGELLKPALLPPKGETSYQLKELHQARQALIKDQTATKNRYKNLCLPFLKRQTAQRIAQIKRQLAAIEAELEAIINKDQHLKRRLQILISIPAIAKATAFALIIDMPELGSLDNKQAASLVGLAPISRQSGNWKGKAFIKGGRKNLRQAIYMPALVACRFNPDLMDKYNALKAKGKPSKVAITAVMRKLIILANALLRDNRTWTKIHA